MYIHILTSSFFSTGTLQVSKQLCEIVFNPSQMIQESHWSFITHYLVNPWIYKPGDMENHSNQGQNWRGGQGLKNNTWRDI